jgi:hypothetical protein
VSFYLDAQDICYFNINFRLRQKKSKVVSCCLNTIWERGARGGPFGSRHCATSWKVAGSIPGGGTFHCHSPSGRTMAMRSTQPLTELSNRNISWGVKAACARADNLSTFMCRLPWNLWASNSRNFQDLSRLVTGIALPSIIWETASEAGEVNFQFFVTSETKWKLWPVYGGEVPSVGAGWTRKQVWNMEVTFPVGHRAR